MPLPQAVQDIGDAAEAAAVKAGIKPGSKPAIEQPVAAVPAEPAKPADQKVDENDWKERYSRYKATTDSTIAELRQTLATIQATLATTQQQNQELLTKLNSAPGQGAAADSEKPATTDPDAAYKKWLDELPPGTKDEYTDQFLRDQFIFQSTTAGKQSAAPPDNSKELQERVGRLEVVAEKTEAQLYEEAMDDAYPKDAWISMTKEPEWAAFCDERVSPIDQRTYGEIVKQGNETHVAPTVIWVLQQYTQYKSDLDTAGKGTAVADPLEGQLTPEGGAAGDGVSDIHAQAETFTVSQVTKFFNDVATTKKYTPEQAKDIEESIKRADKAGKIIQG